MFELVFKQHLNISINAQMFCKMHLNEHHCIQSPVHLLLVANYNLKRNLKVSEQFLTSNALKMNSHSPLLNTHFTSHLINHVVLSLQKFSYRMLLSNKKYFSLIIYMFLTFILKDCEIQKLSTNLFEQQQYVAALFRPIRVGATQRLLKNTSMILL